MIFACLISRAAFHRAAAVAVAAASRVTVVAHANMPGRGDVISGVSFFAVCTYHRAPREKNEQQGIRRKKERERTRERGRALARLRCSRRCCAYTCVRVHVCARVFDVYVHLCRVVGYIHTTDVIAREYEWNVRCVSANAGTITSDSGAATRVITIRRVCVHGSAVLSCSAKFLRRWIRVRLSRL